MCGTSELERVNGLTCVNGLVSLSIRSPVSSEVDLMSDDLQESQLLCIYRCAGYWWCNSPSHEVFMQASKQARK